MADNKYKTPVAPTSMDFWHYILHQVVVA